jgi:hypothetical protein
VEAGAFADRQLLTVCNAPLRLFSGTQKQEETY